MRVGHDVFQGIAIISNELSGHLAVELRDISRSPVDRSGQVRKEGGEILLHLLQLDALLGTLDAVTAERVGSDLHLVTLLQEQGCDLGVTVIQIHEFRLSFLDVQAVLERAGGVRFDRIQHLRHIDIQILDDDLTAGRIGKGALDGSILAARGGRQDQQAQDEDLTISHILSRWRRRWPSVLQASRQDVLSGNPGLLPSEAERDGCACGALPCPARRHRPAGTGRRP